MICDIFPLIHTHYTFSTSLSPNHPLRSLREIIKSTNPPILQSPNFISVVALLAMGGRISYNSHCFAHKGVKQCDL